MRSLAVDPGAEVGAWVAAITGAVALGSQVWKAIKNRTKERQQVNEALDHSPEIRQQLELGNVGEAIHHLNEIIETQSTAFQNQGRRLTACEEEILAQRERADRAEAEAEHWEDKYEMLEHKLREERAQHRKDRKNFARALAQARGEPLPSDGEG